MTTAIVAFYKDDIYIGGVYLNSDGYLSCVGKKLLDFLQKPISYNSLEELYAHYILDPETEVREISKSLDSILHLIEDYAYIVRYNSETKTVTSISVQRYGNKEVFTGTILEFDEFIKRETE
jgi:hypothetical protein